MWVGVVCLFWLLLVINFGCYCLAVAFKLFLPWDTFEHLCCCQLKRFVTRLLPGCCQVIKVCCFVIIHCYFVSYRLLLGRSGAVGNNTANVTTSPGLNPGDPEAALASGSSPLPTRAMVPVENM
jgi:hypothetical protein